MREWKVKNYPYYKDKVGTKAEKYKELSINNLSIPKIETYLTHRDNHG